MKDLFSMAELKAAEKRRNDDWERLRLETRRRFGLDAGQAVAEKSSTISNIRAIRFPV